MLSQKDFVCRSRTFRCRFIYMPSSAGNVVRVGSVRRVDIWSCLFPGQRNWGVSCNYQFDIGGRVIVILDEVEGIAI